MNSAGSSSRGDSNSDINKNDLYVHEMASTGFNHSTDAYERGRPEYPNAVLEFLKNELKIGASSKVCELGSGTGKFTRTLLKTGADITAMEPVEGMRAKFNALLPDVSLHTSTAEQIESEDHQFEFVIAAQAAHWFDAPKAAIEIHRVLRAKGKVVLIWNVRDETSGIFRELTRIMEEYEGDTPRYKSMKWKAGFDQSNQFTPFQLTEFAFSHIGDVETVVDRVGSVSFMAALPESEKSSALKKVREIVAHHPEARGQSEIHLKYVTRIYVAEAR